MAEILLSTTYLPNIQYVRALSQNKTVVVEQYENFIKQSFRNRCTILASNGPMDLSIPIEKGCSKHLIRDTKISYSQHWQSQHWHAIVSAYNSSPYFEYFRDELEPFFHKKYEFLWDFNTEINAQIFKNLNLKTKISLTEDYIREGNAAYTDLRNEIHPKKTQTPKQNYYDETPYPQVFDSVFGFTPNLSVIDMLFNIGSDAEELLKSV